MSSQPLLGQQANFAEEPNYASSNAGIAITDGQLPRLPALIANPKIKGVLIFPFGGKPEETALNLQKFTTPPSPQSSSFSTPQPSK